MKRKTENIIKSTDTVVSNEGELKSYSETNKCLVTNEPSFYKVYTDAILDIGNLFELSPTETKVFTSLAKNMSYNNMVVLIKPVKEVLMKETGISSLNTINKAIKVLKNKGLIISFARSSYIVNPEYVGKGRWEDIQALRIQIEYKKQGRDIRLIKVNKKVIEYEIKAENVECIDVTDDNSYIGD